MAILSFAGNNSGSTFQNLGLSFSGAKQNTSKLSVALQNLKGKVVSVETIADAVALGNPASTMVNDAANREDQKKSALTVAYKKLDELVSNAANIDNKVAEAINANKKAFYKAYSWLKPESEKGFFEKVGEHLWGRICSIGNAIKNIAVTVFEWCKEHWAEILIGLAFIVVGALITVFTAGTGTAFWAAFGAALLKGLATAAISGLVSGTISGGVTYVGARLSGCSREEAFSCASKAFGDGLASGFMSGGIGFAGGAFGNAIGGTYKSFQGLKYLDKGLDYTSKVMDGFEYAGEISNKLWPGNAFGEFYNKLSSNPQYQFFNKSVGYCSTFFSSASSQAKITDDTFKNQDGTYKKNVTFVDRNERGILEYTTTDKTGTIKSQTKESLWKKTISKYDKEGKFTDFEAQGTVYKFDIKKIGKKIALKGIDTWSGNNKYIPQSSPGISTINIEGINIPQINVPQVNFSGI